MIGPSRFKSDIYLPINPNHPLARSLKCFFPIGPEYGATYIQDQVTRTQLPFSTGTPTWASMGAAGAQFQGSDRVLKTSNSPTSAVSTGKSFAALPNDTAFCTIAVGFTNQTVPTGAEFSYFMQGGDNAGVASGGPYLSLNAGNTLSGGASNNYALLYRKVINGTAVNTIGQATVPVTNTYTSLLGEVGTNYAALFVNGFQDGATDTTAYGTGADGWNRTTASGFRRIAADVGSECDAKFYWAAMWNRKLSQREKIILHNAPFELFQQSVKYYDFPKTFSVVNTTDVNSADFGWEAGSATTVATLHVQTAEFDFEAKSAAIVLNIIVNASDFPWEANSATTVAGLNVQNADFGWEAKSASTVAGLNVQSADFGWEASSPTTVATLHVQSAEFDFEAKSATITQLHILPTTSSEFDFEAKSATITQLHILPVTPSDYGWEAAQVGSIGSTHNITPTNADFNWQVAGGAADTNVNISAVHADFGWQTDSDVSTHFVFGLTPLSRTWTIPRDSLRRDVYRKSYVTPDRNYRIPEDSRIWVLPSVGISVGPNVEPIVITEFNIFNFSSEYDFEIATTSLAQIISGPTHIEVNSADFSFDASGPSTVQTVTTVHADFAFEARSATISQLHRIAVNHGDFPWEAKSPTLAKVGGWVGTSTATSLNYYLGTFEGYHDTPNIGSTESALGGRHLDIVCTYTPWDSSVSRSGWSGGMGEEVLFACQNAGNRAVAMTLHPWYAQGGSMSNGTASGYNADWDSIVNSIIPAYNTGNLKIIRIGQEFNVPGFPGYADGGQFPWCNNPPAFKDIFIKLVNRIHSAMPGVLIDWCPNIWWGVPPDYYPGDAYVDIVSMDSYEHNNNQGTGIAAWNAMVAATWGGGAGYGFQWASDFAQTHNKKVGFSENSPWPDTGSVYQAQAKLWFSTRPTAYVVWWNRDGNFDRIVDGSNASTFNSVWGSSSFSGHIGD